jgi:hypothetical protein
VVNYRTYFISLIRSLELAESLLQTAPRPNPSSVLALEAGLSEHILDHAQYLILPDHWLGASIDRVCRDHLPTEIASVVADRVHDQVLQDMRDVLRERFDFNDVVLTRRLGDMDLQVMLDMDRVEQGDYYDPLRDYRRAVAHAEDELSTVGPLHVHLSR